MNSGGYIPRREASRYISTALHRSQNSEYPRIFQVTGANQNARKLLSTDLVNTKKVYTKCRKLQPRLREIKLSK